MLKDKVVLDIRAVNMLEEATEGSTAEEQFLAAQALCWSTIERLNNLPPDERRAFGDKYGLIL